MNDIAVTKVKFKMTSQNFSVPPFRALNWIKGSFPRRGPDA